MLDFLKNKRGQNTAEYAVVFALVIGAIIAMQTYVRRSMQEQIKFSVDKLKKDGSIGQYEPYYLQSDYSVTAAAYKDTEEMKAGGEVERVIGTKTTTRVGTQTILGSSAKEGSGTETEE